MRLSGSIVTMKSTGTISTQAKASTMVATIQTSLKNVNAALAKLSAGAEEVLDPGDFVQKLSDTLTAGIGNLVDANMAQESAMLQSLQVKQQLGVQALSIANQSPQTSPGACSRAVDTPNGKGADAQAFASAGLPVLFG